MRLMRPITRIDSVLGPTSSDPEWAPTACREPRDASRVKYRRDSLKRHDLVGPVRFAHRGAALRGFELDAVDPKPSLVNLGRA